MTPQNGNGPRVRFAGFETATDFHVALVFDSAPSGARALNLAQHLIREFNRDFRFQLSICGYGVFSGAAASSALARADRSDMVLVVSETPFPEPFWLWLRCWAARPRREPAIVAALMKRSLGDASRRIRALCERTNIDFVCQLDSDMAQAAEPSARAGEITHEKLEPEVFAFAQRVVEERAAVPSWHGAHGKGYARCR